MSNFKLLRTLHFKKLHFFFCSFASGFGLILSSFSFFSFISIFDIDISLSWLKSVIDFMFPIMLRMFDQSQVS